jgi:hypothetical protein
MAEHDKVGACIFKRTGGASAVFHDRWDTFVSMAVRVQGAAGHAGEAVACAGGRARRARLAHARPGVEGHPELTPH